MMISNKSLLDDLNLVVREVDPGQLNALWINFNECAHDKNGKHSVTMDDFKAILHDTFQLSDFEALIQVFTVHVGSGVMPVFRMIFGDPELPAVQPQVGYGDDQISPKAFLAFLQNDSSDDHDYNRANFFEDLLSYHVNFIGLGQHQIPLKTYIDVVKETPQKSDLLQNLFFSPSGGSSMAEYFSNQGNVPDRLTLRAAILLDVNLLESIVNLMITENITDYNEILEKLAKDHLDNFMNDPKLADFINHRALAVVIQDPNLEKHIDFKAEWKQIFNCTTHHYTHLLSDADPEITAEGLFQAFNKEISEGYNKVTNEAFNNVIDVNNDCDLLTLQQFKALMEYFTYTLYSPIDSLYHMMFGAGAQIGDKDGQITPLEFFHFIDPDHSYSDTSSPHYLQCNDFNSLLGLNLIGFDARQIPLQTLITSPEKISYLYCCAREMPDYFRRANTNQRGLTLQDLFDLEKETLDFIKAIIMTKSIFDHREALRNFTTKLNSALGTTRNKTTIIKNKILHFLGEHLKLLPPSPENLALAFSNVGTGVAGAGAGAGADADHAMDP
ncbi:MAG: hypothetical protein NTV32_01770 [Gammaproteobacteria bacterium]|nr:hypothetical protein [Gammaproteobacteria bacterium]